MANPFHPDIDSSAAKATRILLLKESRGGGGKSAQARGARVALDALPQHEPAAKPIDVLLATNMLQVGVDVPRLGLMVVTGQPKNSAEYIQASSRVGRTADRPGLIVTIFNWARPRDLAHLETFSHFHETFYARVEPLSVTPFADQALDRGLAARSWAADLCRQWHLGELCDDVALLVNELVTNGIRHAGTELLVELRVAGSAIVVAVSDGSTRPSQARAAAPLDEGGRGLLLVDALSTRWGVTAGPSGKRVWAELRVDASRPR